MGTISEINSTGQQPLPVELERAEANQRISAGDLSGKNMSVSNRGAESSELQGTLLKSPVLDKPKNVNTGQMQNANDNVVQANKLTEKVFTDTRTLLGNIQTNNLTPEQVARLKKHAATLQGTSQYIDNMQGKGLNSSQGKRSVLAGMGFSDTQLDALLSLAGRDDADNSLATLHGGTGILNQKKAMLRRQGFNDSQIQALLSMANPQDGGGLESLKKANNPNALLEALGFKGEQAERLITLLNNQNNTAQFAGQLNLLKKMGFSEAQAEVIVLAGYPEMLNQQKKLMNSVTPAVSELIKANATGFQLLAGNKIFPEKVLEQLVDIYAILELLHEVSANGRALARQSRQLNYEAAHSEILAQADEMKSAALKTAIGGYCAAGAKIVAGVAQGSLAVRSARAPTQAAQQAQVALANGVSQVISASGEMAKVAMDYQASMHHAQVKILEASQKMFDNAAQSDSEFMNLHQDMIRTVQSKMDEIMRSWFETLKSSTRA